MSFQVFQWLREFCASHSHFWAESKPTLCVWMEVCTRGKRRAGSILTLSSTASTRPQGHPNRSSCSAAMANQSQGAKAIIAQIVCSAPFQEPAQLSRADQGDRANQGRNNLCCPTQPIPTPASTFQTWELFISHLEKRKLKRVSKSRACESTAFGSDVPAAGTIEQGLVWDFPPRWFCFAFFQLQPWQRKGLTGSFLRENLEMEGSNR